MNGLTPGLQFLLRSSPKLLTPPFIVYLASNFLEIPTFALTLAYVLSVPFFLYVTSIWASWTVRQEMEKLGAQAIPTWVGKLPGNLDTATTLYDSWMKGYPGDDIDDLTETIGLTFKTRILGNDQVWTSDPRHIKSILATDFEGYAKGDMFISSMSSVLGSGIFNSDGDIWKFHRGITRPYFHRDRISDFQLFGKYADAAISQAKIRLRDGYAIDFQDMLSRFTLDTATAFLFGSCVDSLSAGLPYPVSPTDGSTTVNARHHSDVFARAFSSAQHKIGSRGWSGPLWPLFEMFGDATIDDNEVIDGFIGPILKEALSKKEANEDAGVKINPSDEEDTLLNSLLSQTDDYKVLRDETLNILIAARDTMASLLTFTIYCLSQHPTVADRLRQEILESIGSTKEPTYDDIKEMKYLRAVLNETLRLFPPVPFNTRETTRPTTWPSNNPGEKPYYLPTGTSIVYSVLIMQRNKEFWGPDALEFDPDRFLDERLHKYLIPNPFIFLPFNAGPRLCLGQQFAYNQMSFMLIRLLQTFQSVTLATDAQPPWSRPPASWKDSASSGKRRAKEEFWPKSHLTMYSHGGLWVRMKEAASSET